jgi:hypothetical protein
MRQGPASRQCFVFGAHFCAKAARTQCRRSKIQISLAAAFSFTETDNLVVDNTQSTKTTIEDNTLLGRFLI